jgi:DNA repair exonuclease SbcCD nuclease subunit/ABC-type dipeptide/oligopeptide/nickel transport system ATPase subunit
MLSMVVMFLRCSGPRTVRAWSSTTSRTLPLRFMKGYSTKVTTSSKTTTSALSSTKWNLGDVVKTRDNLQGRIHELRGAGWCTILLDQDQSLLKVRGTNLLAVSDDLAITTTVPPPEELASSQKQVEAKEQPAAPEPMVIRLLTTAPFTGTAPPPPTIINLDAALKEEQNDNVQTPLDVQYLQQVRHHASVQTWVVFTDLHCAPSTLETCLQILDHVHDLARERHAGVLFLGDFWHQRGVLRVDCLNAVLECLGKWTVPMVMIPGNHDQITLRGHDHGITPLENAYRVTVNSSLSVPGPLVFSHPTKFANALFVPHIRDNAVMESVLLSQPALDATAVFVHADVTGALMNDLIQSHSGVLPSMFPAGKPIYSGHFHKPHIVQASGRRIEYLGSPYEVSLAESQQMKALVVLNAFDNFKIIERIPMNIGRKNYKPENLDALLELANDKSANALKAGDRVVFSIDKEELDELRQNYDKNDGTNPLDKQVRELRQSGVIVEIRETKLTPTDGMNANESAENLEKLTPESTWKTFLEQQVQRKAMTDTAADALLLAGQELLRELETDSDEFSHGLMQSTTELQIESVTVDGFGPFRDSVTYPLKNRGLVLLRGVNRDGGSDSNGSGKSSLAMSTLWCLTGSLDPRPLEDSKVGDVVNDDRSTARVTVRGQLNGVEFSLARSKTAKKSEIIFMLNGKDISAQSAKETQLLVDEKLGVSPQVLARTMFHGQHALNNLLEASDSKLKDELSLVVPLNTWQAATVAARKKAKDCSKKSDELNGMLTLRVSDAEELKSRYDKACTDLQERELAFRKQQSDINYSKCVVPSFDKESLIELEQKMAGSSTNVKECESLFAECNLQRENYIATLEQDLAATHSSLSFLQEQFRSVERNSQALSFRVEGATARTSALAETWNLDFAKSLDQVVLPKNCPTCQQPLTNEEVDHHGHKGLQQTIAAQAQLALENFNQATFALQENVQELASMKESVQIAETRHREALDALNSKRFHWSSKVAEADKALSNARKIHEQNSLAFSGAAKLLHETSLAKESNAVVEAEQESLRMAKRATEVLHGELVQLQSTVDALRVEKTQMETAASTMTDLASALGQRGVQTFVLQNAIALLESAAQSYLDDFSDGSQRLHLSLDAGDRISRRASVREANGDYKERALATLSGGQWRRCALALSLGFSDLVSYRGGLRPSLCVLDEPLTHLDRTGRTNVGHVLQRMLRRRTEQSPFGVSTILLILQDLAAEELEESFDSIDEVVKRGGTSFVLVDEEL